jgi:hypothetical protein
MIILYTDQIFKQEQYKDLLREAEHYRLVKAIAQPKPNRLQRVAAALHKAMAKPTRDLPGFRPVEWQARS